MRHNAWPGGITRERLLDWYRSTRARTKALFALITPDAYYDRPIALRNPIVFYEGHIPAFAVNTLVKLALGRKGIDERLEDLFARGIDPEDTSAVRDFVWPTRECVQKYAEAADALVLETLATAVLEDDDVPYLRGGEAVFTVLEHELMHQETLMYMVHQLPYEKKRGPSPGPSLRSGPPSPRAAGRGGMVSVPAGVATLGNQDGFGWDNEFPAHTVHVEAFEVGTHNVTNGEYLEYVEATGARTPHFWVGKTHYRGMFALVPLPLDAPVYVTHDEAAAYARWKGMRLMTEAEYHRATAGIPDTPEGNYDFASFDPVPVGSYPAGASAWGVHDLIGNGWEWTSSIFDGFDGFRPMPSYAAYSADFFDNAHYVMKGASPVTPRELVRRSFRNWFRPNYPYVYATFRCAR